RGLRPFTRVTVYLGKGNNQTFWGLLDTGSELTLVSGDPKKHYGPPVKVGTCGGRVIKEETDPVKDIAVAELRNRGIRILTQKGPYPPELMDLTHGSMLPFPEAEIKKYNLFVQTVNEAGGKVTTGWDFKDFSVL
ncbi:hypothetical protein STEG23_012780, partial [Scotinomys teguina]